MSVDATRATWKLQNISSTKKIILLALADRAGEDAECWPSLKRMEEDTCLNRKTLIVNRQELIEEGFIEYTGELKGARNQIPVMRLTYVQSRSTSTNIGSGESFTSTEIGTGTSTEIGTLNLKEEPKRKNGLLRSKKPTSPLAKELTPYTEIWNNLTAEFGCKKVGVDKDELNAIKRNLKQISEKWESTLTPESFKAWLENAILIDYYRITKMSHRMDICTRWLNFEEAYEQIKQRMAA